MPPLSTPWRADTRCVLQQSEQHARSLCNLSPVSLWVEDFSGVKRLMDEVRNSGIRDFRVFMNVHSDFVTRCMEQIKVLGVNQHTLDMFGAAHKDDLLTKLDQVFRDEIHDTFAQELLGLWNGKTVQMREVLKYTLIGELINIHMPFAVMPGHEEKWDLVLVSLVDITVRKKAEAYLEYLDKHNAQIRLRNSAHYVEELKNQFYPGQKLSLALGLATCKSAPEVEDALHNSDQSMFEAKKRYYEMSNVERRS